MRKVHRSVLEQHDVVELSMRTELFVLLLLIIQFGSIGPAQSTHTPLFDGDSAYDHLAEQCNFGPRPPGSENLSLCRQYMVDELTESGWHVTLQNFTYLGVECVNVIARGDPEENGSIVLGAHYDTRPRADQDPNPGNRNIPIIGANDGASGVAILLELADVLPESVKAEVEIVLFDAEDSGGIDGWDWIVGSNHYVNQLPQFRRDEIAAMILVDLVGDTDLILKRESSSTRSLQDAVWEIAADLGLDDIFVDTVGGSILDDHRPFLTEHIPALDIIQHAPFPSTWHTLEDIPDNCSPESLDAVGRVVEVFVVGQVDSGATYIPNSIDFVIILMFVLPPLALIAVFIYYKRK